MGKETENDNKFQILLYHNLLQGMCHCCIADFHTNESDDGLLQNNGKVTEKTQALRDWKAFDAFVNKWFLAKSGMERF